MVCGANGSHGVIAHRAVMEENNLGQGLATTRHQRMMAMIAAEMNIRILWINLAMKTLAKVSKQKKVFYNKFHIHHDNKTSNCNIFNEIKLVLFSPWLVGWMGVMGRLLTELWWRRTISSKGLQRPGTREWWRWLQQRWTFGYYESTLQWRPLQR